MQQQVGAFILSKAAGKAENKDIWIQSMTRLGNGLFVLTSLTQLPGKTLTGVLDKVSPFLPDECPQHLVTQIFENRLRQALRVVPPSLLRVVPPLSLVCSPSPCRIGPSGIPGRNMHPVGDMHHRHFSFRPVWIDSLKDAATDLAMQPADTIDHPTGSQGQISHAKRF